MIPSHTNHVNLCPSDRIDLTFEELTERALRLPIKGKRIYGVPNGGIYAALLICGARGDLELVEALDQADTVVDDIVDSGATKARFSGYPFAALVDKQGTDSNWMGLWVSFPWERMARQDGPQDAVRRILQYIGEDPDREGLKETPDRVVRSYSELFAGYRQSPADILKVFEDGACDEMVILKGVEFHSCCEHHLQPFFGSAHIAYVPNGKVIGVSKLARIVDIYARRLQIQERLCQQVTKALDEHLQPKGSACILEATHFCMVCRGVGKQHSRMITSSLTGVFRDKPEVRAEFLNLVRG